MRVFFAKKKLSEFFIEIRVKTQLSWSLLAKETGISKRNLFDWRRGKISIPLSFLKLLERKYSVIIPKPKKVIEESEMRSISGKLGGLKTKKLYGNPGTPKGRILGGIHSYKKQILKPNSPFLQKTISLPKYTKELAEFVGILLGDGGITERQITITVHKTDEKEYSIYISKLIYKIFKHSVMPRKRARVHVIVLTISRTKLVNFFEIMKIHRGNKVKNQVDVPIWIKSEIKFKKSCIRGLFDTDGCFYIDKHIIRGKKYINPGINFTNRSKPLLLFFKETLLELGFSPTQSTPNAILLRKEQDVVRYFHDIGSSNSKHIKRFEVYLNRKGRVPKWS